MNFSIAKVVLCLAMVLVLVASAFSCVEFPSDPIPIGTNFQVLVTGIEKPVANLRLQLLGKYDSRLTLSDDQQPITDSGGVALIKGLIPGFYTLSAGPSGSSVDLEVEADGPETKVALKWAESGIVRSRQAFGTLAYAGMGEANALRFPSSLSLFTSSLELLAKAETDSDGDFSFGAVKAGTYLLKAQNFWIPLEVGPEEDAESLDILIVAGPCNVIFVDHNECDESELRVRRACGEVFDPAGAIIPNVKVTLTEEKSHLMVKALASPEGRFDLDVRPGQYELAVSSPGFSPLRQKLSVADATTNKCPYEVQVKLTLAGCSTASSMEKP
ncbi:MAG TPA: carboxypeptidase regulatory-like domain-containing protein [Terriglobales bacterium]